MLLILWLVDRDEVFGRSPISEVSKDLDHSDRSHPKSQHFSLNAEATLRQILPSAEQQQHVQKAQHHDSRLQQEHPCLAELRHHERIQFPGRLQLFLY